MNLRLIFFLIFLLGLGLFTYSLTQPYYKDQKAFDKLINGDYRSGNEFYKRESELRTSKLIYMDIGGGLIVASGAILAFLIGKKIKTFQDLTAVKSFSRKTIFISANIVWLFMIPGTIWYYTFRGIRGDYAPFADSIIIPIMYQSIAYLTFLIPLNLFIYFTTIKSTLPSVIFIKAIQYTKNTIFWETLFGLFLIINLVCFVGFVLAGDHISIIVHLFFTFILLSLRAGQIYKWTIPKELNYQP